MHFPTIAVIDDDADLLGLLRLLFEEQGWATVSFTDSAKALDMLSDASPNLIMLNLWPGSTRSGWEVVQELKSHPALQGVPILICSGAIHHLRDNEHWLREHEIALLVKPFDIDELYRVVDAALRAEATEQSTVALAATAS